MLSANKINFLKNSLRNVIMLVCQTILIQIKPDTSTDLICVQTVYKGYQQETLMDKDFK